MHPNDTFKIKVITPLKVTLTSREISELDGRFVISETPKSTAGYSATDVFKEVPEYAEICPDKCNNVSLLYIRSRLGKYDRIKTDYIADDEDRKWLEKVNQRRESLDQIRTLVFEQLMDEMEKKSYFKVRVNNLTKGTSCSICDQDSAEIILSCYICSLKVHKRCYGVMYDPEFHEWFCRRCLCSPSTPVECVFCPNKHGAFIQTNTDEWAHVLCTFWIPDVYFKIKRILDQVIGVKKIRSRFGKLKCYICLQQTGFCINCPGKQCNRTPFHVTCAQEAGLIEKTEIGPPNYSSDTAIYCHRCNGRNRRWAKEIKSIRNELSKKRNTLPVITYHTFPPEVVEKFNALLPKKKFQNQTFVDEFIKYWFDKRRTKNGIPLISALQLSYKIEFIGNDRCRAVIENKTNDYTKENLLQLKENLENAKTVLNLDCMRGQLEKQLIYLRILTEDILKELEMKHSIDDTIPNPVKLKIIDKLEKCLLENWNSQNTNPDDMIPGLFISTDKLSEKFNEETRRIEKIIFQDETVIQEVMRAIENGLIVLHIPVSLPKIRKNPECLGNPVDRTVTEMYENRPSTSTQDHNHPSCSTKSHDKKTNDCSSGSGRPAKRKGVKNNKLTNGEKRKKQH